MPMSIFYKEGEFVPVCDIRRHLVDKYNHFIYNFGWKKPLLHEDEWESAFVQPAETSVEEQGVNVSSVQTGNVHEMENHCLPSMHVIEECTSPK